MSGIPELFILGIDGLGGDIVIETDYLPNLKKQIQGNKHAVVFSPNCGNPRFQYPHTWPAWTTIWTGKLESEHGIHMPDRKNDIVPNITEQPYITLWEVLDLAGYKCGLVNVQMMRGIELQNGANLRLKTKADDFFLLNWLTKLHLDKLRDMNTQYDVIGYYTIALDHWYHQNMHIDKEMMFLWVDYLIQWCQFYCSTKQFVLVSDHGFDPDKRIHTNSAFYWSRQQGEELDGVELKDVASMILSHSPGNLETRLGGEIVRSRFGYSKAENAQIMKQLEAMGYL